MELTVYYSSDGGDLIKHTSSDSGFDLEALVGTEGITIKPFERVLIPTGVRLLLPDGMDAQVRPRSGLAVKHGLTVLNSPGTIDNGYRGEIKVILINLGQEPVLIKDGQKVAQLVFSSVSEVSLIRSEERPNTDTSRSVKGFGSSDSIK